VFFSLPIPIYINTNPLKVSSSPFILHDLCCATLDNRTLLLPSSITYISYHPTTNMDTERDQGRWFAAMNDDFFLSSQHPQQLQYTLNRETADPAYHKMMPLHRQFGRQTQNARRHTNQNYNALFSSAPDHEIPAQYYGQQQLPMNKVANIQPQRPHQLLQHPPDSRVVQVAHHQSTSAQTNTQLSDAGLYSSPPLLNLQHRMPIHRGVKRPFAETGFTESSPRSQPPPQPEFFHHYPLAAHYQALSTYHQLETSSNQTHGMSPPAREQFHPQQRGPEARLSYEEYVQQAQQAEQVQMMQ
jgi:hypothetical protein